MENLLAHFRSAQGLPACRASVRCLAGKPVGVCALQTDGMAAEVFSWRQQHRRKTETHLQTVTNARPMSWEPQSCTLQLRLCSIAFRGSYSSADLARLEVPMAKRSQGVACKRRGDIVCAFQIAIRFDLHCSCPGWKPQPGSSSCRTFFIVGALSSSAKPDGTVRNVFRFALLQS